MRKRFMQFILTLLGGLVLSGVFFLVSPAFPNNPETTEINVWHKVSTDESTIGDIVALDMSKGYSRCDAEYIYIVSYLLDTEEEVIIAFPNGGFWDAPDVDTTSVEIQKHFGKLEQDLNGK